VESDDAPALLLRVGVLHPRALEYSLEMRKTERRRRDKNRIGSPREWNASWNVENDNRYAAAILARKLRNRQKTVKKGSKWAGLLAVLCHSLLVGEYCLKST
jgi:hypothetical protein